MIQTAIKHKLYEECIEIFFNGLIKNFPRKGVTPVIGEFYRKIIDHEVNDIYYNCRVIRPEDLDSYDDMVCDYEEEGYDIDEIAIAIIYERYSDDDGDEYVPADYDEIGENTFDYDEMPYLEAWK